MVEIERLTPDDWQLLRSGRLAALRDSPRSFGSTLEREMAYSESDWRNLLLVPSFAAVENGVALGLAAMTPVDNDEKSRQVVSMWVTPRLRGTTTAGDLVIALLDVARAEQIDTLRLWVTEDNVRAINFYERQGFMSTGETQAYPNDPSVTELGMALRLSPVD